MTLAQLFYIDGMVAITLGFPTLLVAMWARDRARAVAVVTAPERQAHHAELRKAA